MSKTAVNDVTQDTIQTGKGNQTKFASGWDAIWGKPKEGPEEVMPDTTPPSDEAKEFYKSLVVSTIPDDFCTLRWCRFYGENKSKECGCT